MDQDLRPAREPIFNAPWPAIVLVSALILAYGVQSQLMTEQEIVTLALSSDAIRLGRWPTLATHLFLHGGVGHLAMNAAAAFAFGPPVARLFGRGLGGAVLFFGFFLLCGAIAGLGHVVLNWNSTALLVGASGAISGLWGAASRLLGQHGGLAALTSRPVLSQAIAFSAINVVIGLAGVLANLNIGWQAHLVGYAAGLLLIGPAARVARRV
jgi:membrane associated rhomboid family serine protease